MPKSFTLDGKRHKLDPRVPARQIQWLVDRLHVATPDEDLRGIIAKRAAEGWPAHCLKQAQEFAVYCHRKNQKMYLFVMRGR
jgi:hypothetical protein